MLTRGLLSSGPAHGSLPSLMTEADLVVSATGTSTWELCCLGAPAALVCVVDNQRESYTRVVRHGVATGLGELPELTVAGLPGRAAPAALAAPAWSTLDRRGRARVVDAVFDAVRPVAVSD